MHAYLLWIPLLFSVMTNAHIENQQSNCWDGSFAYKVVTFKVEGDKVELGVKAQFDLFDELIDGGPRDTNKLPLADHGLNDISIYISFNASECTQNTEGLIICETNLQERLLYDRVFAERFMEDIEESFSFISPVYLKGVKATIQPKQAVQIEFFQSTSTTEHARTALVNFPTYKCDDEGRFGNTFFGSVFFPERLRRYLANKE